MARPDYDIYIGDSSDLRGYRVRSFVRDSAPLIASRFSTGQQGQSDLDLLKSKSVDSLSGGMFQRDFEDSEKVARAIGIYNKYDKNFYPAPKSSTATAVTGTSVNPVLKVENEFVSFLIYTGFNAGNYTTRIIKLSSSGYTTLTLPATVASNGFSSVQGACLHKGYLFLGFQSPSGSVNCHRYNIDADLWQDITGGLTKFFTIRNLLYGINSTSDIFSATNELALGAITYTSITTCGSKSLNDIPLDAKEFNGAAYIAKGDGIFRFDGVNATRILTLVTNELHVFNGNMYFKSGDWLYRFDGVNVVRIQFFGAQEPVLSLTSNNDYLFITTAVLTTGYSTGDKFGSVASGLRRIYVYDGASFYLLDENSETLGTTIRSVSVYNANKLYTAFQTDPSSVNATNYYSYDLSEIFNPSLITSSNKLEFTVSEFDDGFPNIFKAIEAIEVLYNDITSSDVITVKYQTYDGKDWSSAITLGTITSTTSSYLEISGSANKLFKRIKINITATLSSGSTLSLKGCAMRYTLQPRMRWRWQFGLMAEGNRTIKTKNRATIASDSNLFTNHVIKSLKQKTPLFFFGPDYGYLKTTINSSVTSFIIKGQIAVYTDPYSEYQLCALKNSSGIWEVFRIDTASYNSGTDETTINIKERGYYGITPATINSDSEFRLAYKVYATRLLREPTQLEEKVINAQPTTQESQIQREFLIECTEV